MKREKKIKLTVKTTTRELQPEALKQAAGGGAPWTGYCFSGSSSGYTRYY